MTNGSVKTPIDLSAQTIPIIFASDRIPDSEWRLIQRAAAQLGMPVTTLIRETVLRRAKRVVRDD